MKGCINTDRISKRTEEQLLDEWRKEEEEEKEEERQEGRRREMRGTHFLQRNSHHLSVNASIHMRW